MGTKSPAERTTYRHFAKVQPCPDLRAMINDLCDDADRLARLEDGIRALEKKYGEYSPADRVSSIHFYRELRALLDD